VCRYQAGDLDAAEKLLKVHTGLLFKIARSYRPWIGGLDVDDLLQEARIGLLHAAWRFDTCRGHCFSTFAFPCMVQHVRRALAAATLHGCLPADPQGQTTAFPAGDGRLTGPASDLPPDEEALAAGPDDAPIPTGARAPVALATMDELSADDEEFSGGHALADEDPQARVMTRELGRWLLAHPALSPSEREVLALRYGFRGDPLTVRDAARALGRNRETVRRTEARALARLREVVGRAE
jgi:RNA polymerase sigma factor (sigma-70 family)